MNRRKFLKFSTICGVSSVFPHMIRPAAAQASTIRMWTFLNPAGRSPRDLALAEIIQKFEAANPGTRVVVETQPFDKMTPKFLAAHSAGNAPDVIWVLPDFLGDAVRSGSLADLVALFISKWSPQQIADNAGAHWNLTAIEGRQYALFTSRNYISVIYRPDMFSEAGIDPAGLTTWNTWLEAAKRLTVRDSSGRVTRWGFAQGFSEQQSEATLVVPWMLGRGVKPFHSDGRAHFSNPAGVEGMTFQTDLVTKHLVQAPQSSTWTLDDVYEQFSAGRVAMILGASARLSGLQAAVGREKVGLMLWPGHGDRLHSPAVGAGWAVGVWSGSRIKEQAGRFVEYMMSPEADRIWVTVGGQAASLASTLPGLGDFAAQPGNDFLRTAAEGFANYGWLTPIDFSVGGYRQILNKAAQRVLVEQMDPAASLRRAEAEFNRQHNR
jgi:multiple sugar transport system substrate-binding protein